MIRAAVVGLGSMGLNHARVLSAMTGVELVAVVDPIKKGEYMYNLPVLGGVDELAGFDVDYAVVAVPTESHFATAMSLSDLDINCLIEKPIAANTEQAETLLKKFESRSLVAGVGHIERFNPAIQSLKSQVLDGAIGDVIQISTKRVGPHPTRIRDVGVVKDLATHDIDVCRWVSQSEYLQISAVTRNVRHTQHEDLLLATGTLENGVVFNHQINWVSPFKERVTTVLGSQGMLVADSLRVELYLHKFGKSDSAWREMSLFKGASDGSSLKFDLQQSEPLVLEHESFIRKMRGDSSSSIVGIWDGLQALRVAEKMISI